MLEVRGGSHRCNSMETFLFTSESVGEGHPDKICDQVSDAVLDAYLKQDPHSKVACETVTKTGMILMLGDISSKGAVDYPLIVRDTIEKIGYDDSTKGFDFKTCSVLTTFDKQSTEITWMAHEDIADEELTAMDQGMVFGYVGDSRAHAPHTLTAWPTSSTRRWLTVTGMGLCHGCVLIPRHKSQWSTAMTMVRVFLCGCTQ